MEREQTQKPACDHGVEVPPARILAPQAGWLYDPKNPTPKGENAPWRQ
jgi:hypothetical protein